MNIDSNTPRLLSCGEREVDLSEPIVMGILNVTPDSFSDGGRFGTVERAVRHAEQMVEEGAAIIDIGGQSTRPGAASITLQEELDRVISVVEAVASEFSAVVSIDTTKPAVMKEAVAAGAGFINDVRALQEASALEVAAELQVPVCLMHMQGNPRTMQKTPHYDDVLQDVKTFLELRVAACRAAGIPSNRILIDPGFGFGKTLDHNLSLFKHLNEFVDWGIPLLVGVSRKSMIGLVLDKEVDARIFGSTALACLAVWQGAAIIRAHDVAATMDAIRICNAVRNAQ